MEINQDMLVQYGLMSKLSTGNSFLDAVLVMLVPFLVNQILPHVYAFLKQLQNRYRRQQTSAHQRVIIHTQKTSACYFYGSDDEVPNHRLQQAILVFLNTIPGLLHKLESATVQLCKTAPGSSKPDSPPFSLFDDDDGDDAGGASEASDSSASLWYPGAELEQFEVVLAPPLETWITVEPGLQFMRQEEQHTTDKEVTTTITFTLVGHSAQQIDDFISRAFDAYRAMLKGQQTNGRSDRYLYLPVSLGQSRNSSSPDGSSPAGDHITYRRYKLTDDKSFDNLFHPDKQTILSLVDNFNSKAGKFAIQGYPQKLGFLLHGPPGTGKTSFIKALAAHTGRSIINIPLSRISTNQQLMDFMHSERVQVEGLDSRVPLPFTKVIYVMEDVDAASHVVHKRGAPDPLAAVMASLRAESAAAAAALTSAAAYCDKAASSMLQAPRSKAATTLLSSSDGDALNLAGLLNVLDGVVDTPGRLIVMTTNHPEMLDPALIRPGRINKKVYMGLMAAAEALQMVRHYFSGQLEECQEQQLLDMWQDGQMSPAALEALCAEFDSVELLLEAVKQLLTASGKQQQEQQAQQESQEEQQQPKQQKQQQKQKEPQHLLQQLKLQADAIHHSTSSVMIRAASCSASFVSASYFHQDTKSCSASLELCTEDS